jgi:hypothetical protein
MKCNDIRCQLPLLQNAGLDQLDADAQAALRFHLDQCPACAAWLERERRLDEHLGKAVRDVPVPDGLSRQILDKLARQPRRFSPVLLASAACLLLAIGSAATWVFWPSPRLSFDDISNLVARGEQHATPESVEAWFRDQRLTMAAPREYDYTYLQSLEVIEFQGRRVPKLIFYRERGGRATLADVLVLSSRQFRLDDLQAIDHLAVRSKVVSLRQDADSPEYYFLRISQGDFDLLLRELN